MVDKTLDKINTFVPEKWRWVLQHGGFRKYFKNTGWMFLGQMAMLISLIVNIWIARYLGPGEFGSLSYIIAFVGIFAFISNLGIADIVVRELVEKPEKRDAILGTSFRLLLFSGLIAIITTITSAFLFESDSFLRLLIIICSLAFLFYPFTVIAQYFQANVLAKKNAWAQIITTVLVSLFKIWVILSGKGILLFVIAFIFDYLFLSIFYTINYQRMGLKIKDWFFDNYLVKKLLSASVLLMLSAAAGYLLIKIDQVMIKGFLDEASVGLYAAAAKLSEIWYFMPGIISASLFPAIINAKKTDKKTYNKRLISLYFFLTLTGFLIALIIYIFSPLIIKIFYGQEYILSVPILQIYVWSGIGMFLTFGINKYLLAENRLKEIFIYNLIAVIINISLNIILIPKIGLLGAAWTTLISYSVWPLLVFGVDYFYKRKKVYDK